MDCERKNLFWESGSRLLYQSAESGSHVGLVALSNIVSYRAIDNGLVKTGFTKSDLFEKISSPWLGGVDDTTVSDWLFLAGSGLLNVPGHDSVEVALAMVGGISPEALLSNANTARDLYRISTNVTDTQNDALPVSCVLHQNYPNPFNPMTNIAFDLTSGAEVALEIYNILGRRVKTLFSGYLDAGLHRFEWDASNDKGQGVATGVYFYKLTTSSQSVTKKMLLIK